MKLFFWGGNIKFPIIGRHIMKKKVTYSHYLKCSKRQWRNKNVTSFTCSVSTIYLFVWPWRLREQDCIGIVSRGGTYCDIKPEPEGARRPTWILTKYQEVKKGIHQIFSKNKVVLDRRHIRLSLIISYELTSPSIDLI